LQRPETKPIVAQENPAEWLTAITTGADQDGKGRELAEIFATSDVGAVRPPLTSHHHPNAGLMHAHSSD
jgi:hypothetical protein